ncbi:hypothetical protein GLOTRDRAFT_111980 [Gloeophyllum trabeum ATCC 11539]|uniref:Uncharacterized protein n=1 Tax=Gloeophyllum trabeum (strain ATCC 11539 / FP-39264 / Madison 617) TaxID=670483 RepID=S7RIU4_GLOTA|nr:uncharacterized protein GLOTRDRAFT_111980 [Gloeophyllum trabeum ATCC 11539]EPQ52499.1 hypothetical protein GLOTRDRAFT_111980 [Gloeophyllum trabeum ATCC 11539]
MGMRSLRSISRVVRRMMRILMAPIYNQNEVSPVYQDERYCLIATVTIFSVLR